MDFIAIPTVRKIYISHPLRGTGPLTYLEIEANRRKVDEICARISQQEPNVLPLSPIHAFSFLSALGPQDRALRHCLELLELADEVWVYGDYKSSEGCILEIAHARSLDIPVFFEGSSAIAGTFAELETAS